MPKKVLVIDDNEQDLKIMKRFLNQLGLDEIFMAETGEQGVSMAKELLPDIVVADTQLPGIDGFEVCKKIKEFNEKKIKVVVLTGFIDAVDAGKARRMGADDYCVKTSDYGYLLKAVRELL